MTTNHAGANSTKGPTRSAGGRRAFCIRMLILMVSTYVGVLAVMLWLENWFLFPGARDREWHEPPRNFSFQEVFLPIRKDSTIHGWWVTPPSWRPEQGAILFSHGNGGNISGRVSTALQWQRESSRAMLIYDYPGYGRSTGKPTEEGCYEAGQAAWNWLKSQQNLPPGKMIQLGESLGGAIAVELAHREPCQAVILCSTFTSFPDMAQRTFPLLPARWLVRNRLDNFRKISELKAPVFLAHGTADNVVPFEMSERLFEAAQPPKRLLLLPGYPHYHPTQPEFFQAVRDFLREAE